jgi:hypothetical protein
VTNRPKAIGTAGETAVTRFAQGNGFPLAERLPLKGSADGGDIGLCPGVIVEVKAGKVAEACADAWLAEAQRQTLAEARNSGAAVALLVTKRRAVGAANVGRWWAWMPASVLAGFFDCGKSDCLEDARSSSEPPNPWLRMELRDALALLRHAGYGNPLTATLEERAA